MQTTIYKDMAFGVPGTHGNGQPYFADPYIAGADVTMGGVAAINTDGMAVPYSATASTPVGIFVKGPKSTYGSSVQRAQSRRQATPLRLRRRVLVCRVPRRGCANWVKGAKLAYDSSAYGLKVDASGTVAEILGVDGGIAYPLPLIRRHENEVRHHYRFRFC